MGELEHLVRSKAYLLPGLTTILKVEGKTGPELAFRARMAQYFERMLDGRELVAPLFSGRGISTTSRRRISQRSRRARARSGPSAGCEGEIFADSHVNLIPTRSGGTHERDSRNASSTRSPRS